ncbi:MAG TPA: DoxX family protein [Thermoanaerobaculia bacterium]|jgi:putative oxidoreductase
MLNLLTFQWLDRYKEYGLFFIRLTIGFRLIYGVADNVFSWAHMIEFRDFLEKLGVPFPLFSAHLSAYAQFICGILFIAGFLFRPAAFVMVINFICALLIAHRTGGYAPAAAAWIMLFTSLGFLFHGAGKLSVDEWLTRRAGAPSAARPAPLQSHT